MEGHSVREQNFRRHLCSFTWLELGDPEAKIHLDSWAGSEIWFHVGKWEVQTGTGDKDIWGRDRMAECTKVTAAEDASNNQLKRWPSCGCQLACFPDPQGLVTLPSTIATTASMEAVGELNDAHCLLPSLIWSQPLMSAQSFNIKVQ